MRSRQDDARCWQMDASKTLVRLTRPPSPNLFLKKDASFNRVRGQSRVSAERGAAGEAGAFIKPDRGLLGVAGFESQSSHAALASFLFQTSEDDVRRARAARFWANVHVFAPREVVLKSAPAAADRLAV